MISEGFEESVPRCCSCIYSFFRRQYDSTGVLSAQGTSTSEWGT